MRPVNCPTRTTEGNTKNCKKYMVEMIYLYRNRIKQMKPKHNGVVGFGRDLGMVDQVA